MPPILGHRAAESIRYLFGYPFKDADGGLVYDGDWALTRADEKRAFEKFVDFVMTRWAKFPRLHIYHYAPYEPAALKRLMGRYATREEEIDRMLARAALRRSLSVSRLRASVESYSIKRLEPFYSFARATSLAEANSALAVLQANLELSDPPAVSDDTKSTVRAYNEDDCQSAAYLRDWLETHTTKLVEDGANVPRPEPGHGASTVKITDWLVRINALIERLTADVPADLVERTEERHVGSWPTSSIGTAGKKRRYGGSIFGWLPCRLRICSIMARHPRGAAPGRLRSLRGEQIARVEARHQITEAQFAAGRRYQALHEIAVSSALRSLDLTRPVIDKPFDDRQRDAMRRLRVIDRSIVLRLGVDVLELMRAVLLEGPLGGRPIAWTAQSETELLAHGLPAGARRVRGVCPPRDQAGAPSSAGAICAADSGDGRDGREERALIKGSLAGRVGHPPLPLRRQKLPLLVQLHGQVPFGGTLI